MKLYIKWEGEREREILRERGRGRGEILRMRDQRRNR